MSSLTELPELPEKDLPRLEDMPEAQQTVEEAPAPPDEEAVDKDQYTFYDVPEDGEEMYDLPDA